MERFSPQVVRVFIERENAFVIVGMDGTEAVCSAMAMYSDEVGEGKIASIAVLRRMRGQGVGAQLLDECENIFRKRGLRKYSLEVEVGNEPAISLYSSKGYHAVGVINDFYGLGRHAYCMEKRVSDDKGVKLEIS